VSDQTTPTEGAETPATTALSRRRLLQGAGLAGVAAFLAACGTKGQNATASAAATAAPATAAPATAAATATPALGTQAPATAEPTAAATAPPPAATPSAEVNWANWTFYMDVDPNDPNKHPTLDAFTAKYGTKVNYAEVVNDNDEFFGTIQPALQGGADTGWDIVTLTDWMAAKLIRLGWVEQFNLANMPNFVANLADTYKGVDWDKGGDRHAPWQSGMTGLGFNPAKTGDLTSVKAFFTDDPRWKGKVDILSEMRDAVGCAMLSLGLDPTTPTRDAADQAFKVLMDAKNAKIIRAFKGNEYAQDLAAGNVVLAMAWSGDMVQLLKDKPDLKFVIADEGGLLWTDNMLIPKGAVHKGTAELLMDYYYQPDVAAALEAYVNYICPVKGAAEAMKKSDPETANNPLIFPPADIASRLKIFGGLSEDEELYYNQQFAKVTGKG
jgi:spermidine/putrescine transport system substrate-binding protein